MTNYWKDIVVTPVMTDEERLKHCDVPIDLQTSVGALPSGILYGDEARAAHKARLQGSATRAAGLWPPDLSDPENLAETIKKLEEDGREDRDSRIDRKAAIAATKKKRGTK